MNEIVPMWHDKPIKYSPSMTDPDKSIRVTIRVEGAKIYEGRCYINEDEYIILKPRDIIANHYASKMVASTVPQGTSKGVTATITDDTNNVVIATNTYWWDWSYDRNVGMYHDGKDNVPFHNAPINGRLHPRQLLFLNPARYENPSTTQKQLMCRGVYSSVVNNAYWSALSQTNVHDIGIDTDGTKQVREYKGWLRQTDTVPSSAANILAKLTQVFLPNEWRLTGDSWLLKNSVDLWIDLKDINMTCYPMDMRTMVNPVTTSTWRACGYSEPLHYYVTDGTARYVLYYLNAHGAIDSLLIEGNTVEGDTNAFGTARHDVQTTSLLDAEHFNYINNATHTWTLNTGFMDDNASSMMWQLLTSPHVWLWDSQKSSYPLMPVKIMDTSMQYKTFKTNGSKPVNYTLKVQTIDNTIRR